MHLRILSEHLRLLAGIQMSLRMSTGTSRSARRSTSWHHTCHHRSCLAHLRSSWPGDSGMHLRSHGNALRLSPTRDSLGGRMCLRHGMAAVDSHARRVLGSKRLRHAHHGQNLAGKSRITSAQVSVTSLQYSPRLRQEVQTRVCLRTNPVESTSGAGSRIPLVPGRITPTAKRSDVP